MKVTILFLLAITSSYIIGMQPDPAGKRPRTEISPILETESESESSGYGTMSETEYEKMIETVPNIKSIKNASNQAALVTYFQEWFGEMVSSLKQAILAPVGKANANVSLNIKLLPENEKNFIAIATKLDVWRINFSPKAGGFVVRSESNKVPVRVLPAQTKNYEISITPDGNINIQ